MKILVFSWRGPKHPLSGGAEQVMHEHMKGWIDNGHSVTLFTSIFDGGKKNELIDGVNIIRKGSQFLQVHIFAFFWYLKHKDFDLVVDQFHGIPFFTPLYVKRKIIAVLQEVAREVWLKNDLPWPINYVLGGIGYFIEPVIFLFYKKTEFMVGSKSALYDLEKMGISKSKVTIVPHGVLINAPKKLQPKEKEYTITFLGALAKDKGIEDALEVFRLLSVRKNIKFWVIGRGGNDYVKRLKEKCKDFGIESRVKFWGFVNESEKFDLLSRSHVLVNTSFKEGWGLVNIEANAVGTPVVAYSNPGLVDSVKNEISGILVSQNNVEALTLEINKLLDDKKKLKKLSVTARNWSKNFNWEKSKDLSLKLIKEL